MEDETVIAELEHEAKEMKLGLWPFHRCSEAVLGKLASCRVTALGWCEQESATDFPAWELVELLLYNLSREGSRQCPELSSSAVSCCCSGPLIDFIRMYFCPWLEVFLINVFMQELTH